MSCQAREWVRARRQSYSGAAYPTLAPQVARPASAATASGTSREVIDLATEQAGGPVPKAAQFLFFGTGADNDVLGCQVWGWRPVNGSGQTFWVPFLLFEVSATLGTAVGVSGALIADTERFADTITIVAEPTRTADVTRMGRTWVMSPTNNLVGWVEAKIEYPFVLEVIFKQTTGTPASNCLVGLF